MRWEFTLVWLLEAREGGGGWRETPTPRHFESIEAQLVDYGKRGFAFAGMNDSIIVLVRRAPETSGPPEGER